MRLCIVDYFIINFIKMGKMEEKKVKLVEQFMNLMEFAIGRGEVNCSYADCDWKSLIRLSKRNKCSLLFNNAVNKNPGLFNIEEELLEEWNNYSRMEFVNSYNSYT